MRIARICVKTPRRRVRIPRIRISGTYAGVIIVDRRNPSREYNFLTELGITLGEFNKAARGYKYVTMPLEAYEKLQEHWGQFFWSLYPEI